MPWSPDLSGSLILEALHVSRGNKKPYALNDSQSYVKCDLVP